MNKVDRTLNDPEHRLGTDTPIERTSADRRRDFFWGVLATLSLLGVLYFTGIYQSLLYQKTSETAERPVVESMINEEVITVPLNVIIFRNDESMGSTRSVEGVENMIVNANNVWHQANIDFTTVALTEVQKNDDELIEFQYKPGDFITTLEEFDSNVINVFLVRTLQGINGISYGGLRTVSVADKTTVYDFRALAHEIGHQLGLDHRDDDDLHLMTQGANGFVLDINEMITAREEAELFST